MKSTSIVTALIGSLAPGVLAVGDAPRVPYIGEDFRKPGVIGDGPLQKRGDDMPDCDD